MTPRTKEQNEAIRRQRMFQIQKTAAEVFMEKGLNMEIGDIAKKAGLGRGTVYHYYNNKLTLLEELLSEALQEAIRITSQTIYTTQCPLVRIERFAETQLNQWLEKPYLYILFKTFFQTEPLPIPQQDRLREAFSEQVYQPVLISIKEAMDSEKVASLDPETLAQFYFGTLIGTASNYFHRRRMKEPIPPDWRESVITLLFKGLKR